MSEDLNELKKLFDKLQKEMQEDEEFENIMSMSFDSLEEEIIKEQNSKTLKVKKLDPDAVLPFYNYETDSGFDLYSVEEMKIPPLGRGLVPTGLSFQFDMGYEIQVRTKSGLAINQGLMVLNSPGTVDQGYSGEIKVPVFNANNAEFVIKKGMKVAQAVLCPVVNGRFVKIKEVDELEKTDRSDKGFGSTGI